MAVSNDLVSLWKADESEFPHTVTAPPTPPHSIGFPHKPRDLKRASPAPMPLHFYPLYESTHDHHSGIAAQVDGEAYTMAPPRELSTLDILSGPEEIMDIDDDVDMYALAYPEAVGNDQSSTDESNLEDDAHCPLAAISVDPDLNVQYFKQCKFIQFNPKTQKLSNLDIVFTLDRIFGPGITRSQLRRQSHACNGQPLQTQGDNFSLLQYAQAEPRSHPRPCKERYAQRKKPKKGKDAIASWYPGEGSLDVDHEIEKPEAKPDLALHYAPATPTLGRGARIRVPVKNFKDFLATSTIPFEIPMFGLETETPPESPGPSSTPSSLLSEQRRSILEVSKWKITRKSGFRLYKSFWTLEAHPHDPELFFSDFDILESSNDGLNAPQVTAAAGPSNPYHPFPNWSLFKLGEWFWADDGGKSRESFQRLVSIISDGEFIPSDIQHTSWKKIETVLGSSEYDDPSVEGAHWDQDGSSWRTTPVTIDVPFNSATNMPGSKKYTLDGFRFRPLIPIIVSKLQDQRAFEHFHIVPSELRWDRDDKAGHVRVYGEMYHSEVFLDAYRDVQLLPPEAEDDHLARGVVALMLSSDETHLTSFGNAHLWPVYLQFGNESKHRRGKASLKLFDEIAYFQKLPDSFVDWYLECSGRATIADDVVTHVRRDLFQAQWAVLLDEEFAHAYKHGLVVKCADGVKRRFYPRILTYAADYPEKMRVVGLRPNGGCPCPRCLVTVHAIPQMGMAEDREVRTSGRRVDDEARKEKVENARKFIFGPSNYSVDAAKVEGLLKDASLTPTRNAFSERLSILGLNVYDLPAVDILHEVELGVWKSLFIHLLRLLEVTGNGKRDVLNRRFRQIPTFGRDTVRRFSQNVADMKQLAARDLEDILQCALAAFDGLFPGDHDGRVQDLIFALAHWHALAKLRMHTELTLEVLDLWTSIVDLPDAISQPHSTVERGPVEPVPHLPSGPTDSRVGSFAPTPAPAAWSVDQTKVEKTAGRNPRKWSLSTPKFHSMGDVVQYIRKTGTTDSYSTQLSERFHRFPKSRYRRTNKKNVPKQLSVIQTRQARIKRLRDQLYPAREEVGPFEQPFPSGGEQRYFIGQSQNQPVNIPHFIRLNSNDPATKASALAGVFRTDMLINCLQGFLEKLKRHMFPRIIEAHIREVQARIDDYPSECLPKLMMLASKKPSERDLDSILFHSETIYRHNVLEVPYITDDCRQDIDTINPRTSRRDFMCLPACDKPESSATGTTDEEGYIYGRVLGIFHANVIYRGAGALDYRRRRFDFLWVRWFMPIAAYPWSSKRLDRVKLAPVAEAGSCDFIDPANILRAAHIIPRFAMGRLHSDEDVKRSIFSKAAQDGGDWKEYYVNRFVDRDMTMRFHPGLAVGHLHSPGPQTLSHGTVRFEDPMEVDAPDIPEGQAVDSEAASEGSEDSMAYSSEEESGDAEYPIPEADSEEEPDIYG
ncbi:hypothetical protein NMY22_g5192 [Coprinellus aureogranulatus]|nr:hypothetical protein NMY22_g5192 [Coprinellus aureogranulatus]